jgi:hypothetical protein
VKRLSLFGIILALTAALYFTLYFLPFRGFEFPTFPLSKPGTAQVYVHWYLLDTPTRGIARLLGKLLAYAVLVAAVWRRFAARDLKAAVIVAAVIFAIGVVWSLGVNSPFLAILFFPETLAGRALDALSTCCPFLIDKHGPGPTVINLPYITIAHGILTHLGILSIERWRRSGQG